MVAVRLNDAEHETFPGTNSGRSFGPLTVPAGYTITSIDIEGGISFAVVTTTAGIALQNFLQHGIQHGSVGYTPTSPEGLSSLGTEWLAFSDINPVDAELSTVHGGSGSDVSSRYPIRLHWRGQFYTPSGTDVYYSVGRFYNPGFAWNFHGNFVVTYG